MARAARRPLRATACECERTADPNLAQVLQIVNGELINRKLADPKNASCERSRIALTSGVSHLSSVG